MQTNFIPDGPGASVRSVVPTGASMRLAIIEAMIGSGDSSCHIMGVAHPAELRDRVRAAVANSGGMAWPGRPVMVHVHPLGSGHRGSCFDLAVAVAVLTAADPEAGPVDPDWMFVGELALDGKLRSTADVGAAVQVAAKTGHSTIVVPEANMREAVQAAEQFDGDIEVLGVQTLAAALHVAQNGGF